MAQAPILTIFIPVGDIININPALILIFSIHFVAIHKIICIY